MAAKKPVKKISTKLKLGDEVIVNNGKSKSSKGKILALDKISGRVLVQGVNLRKRFVRPSQENPKGGIMEAEAPLHISNIQYYDAKEKKATRIKAGTNKTGKKTRVSVRSNKEID